MNAPAICIKIIAIRGEKSTGKFPVNLHIIFRIGYSIGSVSLSKVLTIGL